MLERNCKSCDHFVDSGHSVGTCRRYPTYQNRSPNERCGEFAPMPYAQPVPEMLALPVVNMTPTYEEVRTEFDKAFAEYQTEFKPKRKYTKKVAV